jgi:energy-coupling factor transporter ATP-binding protein EcfA2
VGRRIGGRFAFRYFERTYLDWLVTQLRELKLTGIVSNDTAKKPKLEQVFVSLRMGGERNSISFMECTIAVCNEIRRNPRRRRALLEALKMDLERASSDQRKEAEEYIARSIKEKKHRAALGPNFADLLGALLLRSAFLGRLTRSMAMNLSMEGISDGESSEGAYASTLFNQILHDNQRLAILGSPGSGKSTLLQYVGLAYARARAGDSKLRRKKCHRRLLRANCWRLPIFVPLSLVSKALADPLPNGNSRTILDILPTILPPDLQNDLALKFFKKKISAGECVILFDGLDEVPTEEEFKVVVNSIESFTLAHPKNQYILTSRIAGWRSGIRADFRVFYLAELSESQIDAFITTWCEAVELNAVVGRLKDEGQADRANRRRRALQHSTQLKEALKSNRGMRQLASNPMLLSIIALVHYSLPDLPKERTKLYSDCSKILLEQWDMLKGRRVDDTRLSLEQKETILRRIAFALHTGEIGKKGGSREANRQEVQKLLSTLLPNFNKSSSESERLLTRLIERSGIIVERQRDILAFSHLTFQEYFVASYLAKSKSADFLLQEGRIFTDWWREVAVMYSGLLEDSSEFLKSLQKYNHLFSTKLLLAGICLGESQVVKQISVRESICTDLVRLHTLGQLSGPAADFRELSGFLTDWSRSDTARRKAVAFAIKCALESGDGKAHLERLGTAIREGDPEDARLYISAVQMLPDVPISAISEAICAHIRRRDSKCSIEAINLVAKITPNTNDAVLLDVFEAAFSDPDSSVRAGAIDSLAANPESMDLLNQLYPDINRMLSDENWRTRQSAAKAYARYIRNGASGAANTLFELIGKEEDEDVLEAAFDSLAEATNTTGSKDILDKTS